MMTDPCEPEPEVPPAPAADAAAADPGAIRRRALMLGALATSAVVTIRPALAATATSVLNCQIPVVDPAKGTAWLNEDGRLVSAGTPGAISAPGRMFTGEQIKAAMASGRPLPGADYRTSRAYMKYIGRLQQGTSGFTCFASLQMPRS